MTLQQINDRWGKYLWKAANMYHTGIWDVEDVYNDLLIKIFIAMRDGQLPTASDKESERRVISFIISRSINLVRMENRRQRDVKKKAVEILTLLGWMIVDGDLVRGDECQDEITQTQLMDMVKARLPERDAKFILELAFPSPCTVACAMLRQDQKRQDDCLRMNINELKITTTDVAHAIAPHIGMIMSPATISRVRQNARQLITAEEIEND